MPNLARPSLRWFIVLVMTGVLLTGSSFAGFFETESRREVGVVKRKVYAAQFLSRATFGPTIEEIEALATRMGQIGVRQACEEWIDEQMELPASLHRPLAVQMIADDGYTSTQGGIYVQRYRYHAWWHQALNAPDQLRQRTAWALIQILVTSEDGAGFNDANPGHHTGEGRWLGPTSYYDLMVENAFGNYADLLSDVTYHPVMGTYLSHNRNRKTDEAASRFPDENYAREIMQLFTIGLYELEQDGRLKRDDQGQLIPTYDNDDIKEYAKVFTGLAMKPHPNAAPNSQFWWGNELEYPMEMFNTEHEPGTKTLLGGEVIGDESSVDGNADIAATIQNLMSHENVGPFIARRLIQRLVKSNPSRGYIRRVARKFNDNGEGVKGDLATVIKTILLDPEAWRGQRAVTRRDPMGVEVRPRGTGYSSLVEPTLRYSRLMRGTYGESDYQNGYVRLLTNDGYWQQAPYKQPSVFSFFLPDYQPPGEIIDHTPSRRIPNGFLTAPEFQVKTAVTSNHLQNKFKWDIYNGYAWAYSGSRVNFDYSRWTDIVGTSEGLMQVLDEFDLLFCSGTLPQDFKLRMHDVISTNTAWMPDNSTWASEYENWRVQTAMQVILCSPFAAVSQ
ncbi:MAG: DUF1800 family protein [Planctomycetota bacterium]